MKRKPTRKSSLRSTRRSANGIRYDYDRESDILLITLSREKPDFAEQSQNIITHYNKSGKPIEIEILDASKAAVEILKAILPSKGAAA
jgi:uncharacterized protein YuzE